MAHSSGRSVTLKGLTCASVANPCTGLLALLATKLFVLLSLSCCCVVSKKRGE